MKLVKPGIRIVDPFKPEEILKKIELAARTCYQSVDDKKITDPEKFIRNIIKRGHTSVTEHVSISFRVITDRGISHEWVRHRIASYSQESTRYCKYDDDVVFIKHINDPMQHILCEEYEHCEESYNRLLEAGAAPQIARQVLNNGVKTEIYVTKNLRELMSFFKLRADKAAHPYMKELTIPFLLEMKDKLPCFFENIPYDEEFYEKRLKGYIDGIVTYDTEYATKTKNHLDWERKD